MESERWGDLTAENAKNTERKAANKMGLTTDGHRSEGTRIARIFTEGNEEATESYLTGGNGEGGGWQND